MKKIALMAGVFVACFLLSMMITSFIINKDSSDMTTEMKRASLPVVHIIEEGRKLNTHYGYTCEMMGNYVRDSLSPVGEDRTIEFIVDTFGTGVEEIGYEVRSTDMTRLIEDSPLSDYSYENKTIHSKVTVKDLINPETEYMFILKLKLDEGTLARYYIRFIEKEGLNLKEKLDFAFGFSEATFDKEKALDLKVYMESSSEGDNSSFGHVDIHSSFDQLTWGNLNPRVIGAKKLSILEIDSQNASFMLKYQVEALSRLYNITEYLGIREGSERMHLMEYERTMDQVITDEEKILVNNKLIHGIVSEPIEHMENSDGNIYTFVQQNRLYSFNEVTGNLVRIFSFWDQNNNDERTILDRHSVRLLRIDEQGNILFLVSGYMNRGAHEGEEGIILYYYDSVYNSIEEQMFIPYGHSFELLDHEMDILCHLNYTNLFYVYLDSSVYEIDIDNKEQNIIATGLDEQGFFAGNDNNVIAWQTETDIYHRTEIRIKNLDTGGEKSITADTSDILKPLGFMGNDLVYGKAKISDIRTDELGRTLVPMYSVCIADPSGNIRMEYSREGYYVMEAQPGNNLINLKRSIKDESGSFVGASDDQILTGEKGDVGYNSYTSVVTEELETTWQTVLHRESIDSSIKVLTPKEVIVEGRSEVMPKEGETPDKYYIYLKGEVDSIYTQPTDAVNRAQEIFSDVVDRRLAYIYESGYRKDKVTIEGIMEPGDYPEGTSATAVCVDSLLRHAGVYTDIDELIKEGNSFTIIQNSLEGKKVLGLSGCKLSAMLYYVSIDHPVLAFVDNLRAVLIVGYDPYNILLLDPQEGGIYKKGLNDSDKWFNENGNRFITYVD